MLYKNRTKEKEKYGESSESYYGTEVEVLENTV